MQDFVDWVSLYWSSGSCGKPSLLESSSVLSKATFLLLFILSCAFKSWLGWVDSEDSLTLWDFSRGVPEDTEDGKMGSSDIYSGSL